MTDKRFLIHQPRFGAFLPVFLSMRYFNSYIGLLFLLPMTTLVASPLGFESLVQTALTNNRDLKAARFTVWKAKGRLAQAGKWINPELELSGFSDVVFRNEGAGAFSLGIAQEFPLTSRLSLAKESARLDVLRSLREIRNHERLLIAKVRTSIFAFLASVSRAAILADLLQTANKTTALADERFAAGQGSLTEKCLALVDQRKISHELDATRLSSELTLLELKALLGLEAKEILTLSDTLDSGIRKLDLLTDMNPSIMHRPDVDLLILGEEKAHLEIALAQAEAWEGIRIGIQYTYDRNLDEPEGLGTDNFLGLAVSIPLPVWNQKKGLLEERTAVLDETRARISAARLEIENALASSLIQTKKLKKRLDEFDSQTLSPIINASEEMTTGFEAGRVELRDLFAVREQLGKLRLDRISLQTQLASALTDLESTAASHPAIRRNYVIPTSRIDL
jgi:outer membrane protein, heavy metal efflux system